MARQVIAGFETRSYPGNATDAGPDGYAQGTTAPVAETTIFRSGDTSAKCAGTSVNTSYMEWAVTATSGQYTYARAYVYLDALPSATTKILAFAAGATALFSARVTSTGLLQLWNDAGAVQIGSSSVDALQVGVWYRVELSCVVANAANDGAELRVTGPDAAPGDPGATVASTAAVSITNTQPTQFRVGWLTAPGVTANLYADDVAVNDATGTAQNTWPGHGRCLLVGAGRFNSRTPTSAWFDCTGSSSAATIRWSALANRPPQGHAHSSTDTFGHQLFSTSTDVTAKCQTSGGGYTTYGLTGNLAEDVPAPSALQFGDVAAREMNAIGFLLNGTIDYIELELSKTGAPTDDVIVELRTDSGSGTTPSSTVLDSASIDAASLTTTLAYYSFVFQPVALDAGTRYWIVIRRSGALDAVNYFNLSMSTGGSLLSLPDRERALYSSGAWLLSTGYIRFKLWATQGYVKLACAQAWCAVGSATGTTSKNATLESTTSPVIAAATFDYAAAVAAVGAYPGNGWRWAKTGMVYNQTIAAADASPIIKLTKTDGTTTGIDFCFMGLYCEWSESVSKGSVWKQVTKTADSTLWWARRQSVTTQMYGALIRSGYWAIMPNPLDPTTGTAVEVADDGSDNPTGYT